ncbi:MAG: hypothetical protein Fur0024_5080 [Patescibacteria group bacterium]
MKMGFSIYLMIFIVTLITTAGDFFLKLASDGNWKWFVLGWIFYSFSAIGWFLAYKYVELSSIGIIYGLMTTAFFIFYGVVFFKEKINLAEMIGIGTGFVSLFLLSRFAE